jgi:malonyl-CoA decarboxylase
LALNAATESPSAKLINQLNLAPQGTQRLIGMREDLLAVPKASTSPGLAALDRELESAFTAWFNAGFLELRRIGWDSPAALLERIIRYEAVHEIHGWDDLRRRVEPVDRRCYGFFHPQMRDDPLIFVEVALTPQLPGGIHQIIAEERETIDPREANCAIFYSISNCQKGLKGIPFGNHLAARYLVTAKGRGNQPADPVARFHLGNGARLEAVHANADLSPNGQKQSHGVMVNYLYDLADIEANFFALTELGTVATSKTVQALVDDSEGSDKKGNGKKSGSTKDTVPA